MKSNQRFFVPSNIYSSTGTSLYINIGYDDPGLNDPIQKSKKKKKRNKQTNIQITLSSEILMNNKYSKYHSTYSTKVATFASICSLSSPNVSWTCSSHLNTSTCRIEQVYYYNHYLEILQDHY